MKIMTRPRYRRMRAVHACQMTSLFPSSTKNFLPLIGLLLGALLLIVPLSLHAQHDYDVWQFGHGYGLDFRQSPPGLLENTPVGTMSQAEGSAVICDRTTGELLFSSDGVSVFNRAGNVMPNGDGLIGGAGTSTQAALIVPSACDPNRYYLFTTDQEGYQEHANTGVRYSVVDMSQDGGLGDVVTKNVLMLPHSSEHMTAVMHQNGHDYWVLTHSLGSNLFYAFLVDANGVAAMPVVSVAGIDPGTPPPDWTLGYLKGSPDGRRLAMASQDPGLVELFDFDPATGQVSNPLTLLGNARGIPYGLSFSPDGNRLYAGIGDLVQWSLDAGTPAGIVASATVVSDTTLSSSFRKCAAIQIGPDGMIYYLSSYSTISIVTNPNARGRACGVKDLAIQYSRIGVIGLGLPNNIDSRTFATRPYAHAPVAITVQQPDSCSPALISASAGFRDYNWSNGEKGESFISPQSGDYTLVATDSNGCTSTASVSVKVNPTITISIVADGPLAFCEGDSVTLTAQSSDVIGGYRWSTGETSSSIIVKSSGTYSVSTGAQGCTSTAWATVTVSSHAIVSITSDGPPSICNGDSLRLTAQSPGTVAGYLWSTGETSPSIIVRKEGTYSVATVDGSGCSGYDTIVVVAAEGDLVRLSLARNASGTPGDTLDISLRLEDITADIDSALKGMILKIDYDTSMMHPLLPIDSRLLDRMTRGTLLTGWSLVGSSSVDGILELILNPPTPAPKITATGELLRIPFGTFLGVRDSSRAALDAEIPFTVESAQPSCIRWTPSPGHIHLALCGAAYRLIEMTSGSYALDAAMPNPFNPTTQIRFSLGLDGPTRLDILDVAGRVVARLVDGHLAEGRYSVTWDATAQPSGLYYCRLRSGDWSRTGTLLLVK
jgi:hypothetical protein